MATPSDEFRTIRRELRNELKVQGSKFIATAFPVTTKEQAEHCIGRVKSSFHDATHNCYAYRIGFDGALFRHNDDGEPSGTAGKPILAAIDKVHLTDVCVVVTRYFGGTKLGVGGLARAYAEAAQHVLPPAEIVTRYVFQTFAVSFPHAHISNVMHIVSQMAANIVTTVYDDEVHLTLEIRKSKSDELTARLIETTRGTVSIKSPA